MNSPAKPKYAIVEILQALLTRRMLVNLLHGFSCGVPLLLTGALMQAWLKDECVSIEHISLFGLVMVPYSLKFVWAPLLDRYTIPFFGRRKGWLLIIQLLLACAIMAIGQNDPLANPWLLAVTAFLLVFFAASQDIVVDAHRREILPDNQLGLGSSIYVLGYRVGMLLASGGGLVLADLPGWTFGDVYLVMGLLILVGIFATILAAEPIVAPNRPNTLREAVVEPFVEFFSRKDALLILLFILLYKFGDAMAGHITTPFYQDMGFSKTDIGVVVKVFGFSAILVGALVGGLLMVRLGIFRSLFLFGILQMVSTAGFAYMAMKYDNKPFLEAVKNEKVEKKQKKDINDFLPTLTRKIPKLPDDCVPKSQQPPSDEVDMLRGGESTEKIFTGKRTLLAIVIAFENFSAGLGMAALMAFMLSLTSKRFTATQYALFSSLTALSANVLNAPAGYIVAAVGWQAFFTFCSLIAIPGLLLLIKFRSWIGQPTDTNQESATA